MAELITCSPMADEPIWGHYRRVVWLNGLRSLKDLTPHVDAEELSPRERSRHRHREVIYLLAGTRDRSALGNYFRDHSIYFQLLDPGEINPWHDDWLSLLYRWSSPHAWLTRSNYLLSYCPDCARDDELRHGYSWYRRMHQYPGIEFCATHGLELQAYTCVRSLAFFDTFRAWHSPDSGGQRQQSPIPPFLHRYMYALSRLHMPDLHGIRPSVAKLILQRFAEMSGIKVTFALNSQLDDHVRKTSPRPWFERCFSPLWRQPPATLSPRLALNTAAVSSCVEEIDDVFQAAKVHDRLNRRQLLDRLRGKGWW